MSSRAPVTACQKDNPTSRKERRQTRNDERDIHVSQLRKTHRLVKENPFVDQAMFWKERMDTFGVNLKNVRALTDEEIFVGVVDWVCRDEEELENLNEKVNTSFKANTSLKNKRDRLKEKCEAQKKEFKGGMSIIDLRDKNNVLTLLLAKDLYVALKQQLKEFIIKYGDKDKIAITPAIEAAVAKFEKKY
ncbi:hypothetical protein EIN_284820 [Entamoeba invadens IP1]|uniref:Uncharacterized protein n=1 Tax=Entamoeba invadens IP1 TaxID=370355 RepID=L7FJV3_ENTIV|nr:hypothetical protein EIN_284820 [Entamoeba invadens IP1]ELP84896.1 hypothetical protein EIN_284820 [Entamoeba invadens IP1]|eukprot:XP_004184242.1 hypothetical protein EIN_284820 [Entamoeba invadens IP1]